MQRTELYQNVEDPTILIQAIPGGLSSAEATYRDLEAVIPGSPEEPDEQVDTGRAGRPLSTGTRGGLLRAGAGMAVATIVSRITGLLVKIAIGAIFATGLVSDSYTLANTLPNIVFELLIGGVLTSVAIPLLTRAQRDDADGGAEYTQRLMTMAVVGLAAATAVAVLAAPWLTRLYLSSGNHASPAQATAFARLLLPQIFFYGVAALFGAILNSRERFAANAWAPVVNNIVVIAVAGLLAVTHFGDRNAGSISTANLLILGVGTTLGIVAQAAVMIPSLRKAGFRWKWRWGFDPRFREAGRLIGWATVYVLISQIGVVVTNRVASGRVRGGITQFQLASLIFQMPYGILGVAVLTAIMPRMSRHAAAGDIDAVKNDASTANRLSTVALLPVTAGLLVLGEAAAVVLFRHGSLVASQAQSIGIAVGCFALGLVPLSVTLVQMRVFYAMKDGRTPTLINLIMVAVRVPLMLFCLTLPPPRVVAGLAISTAVSYLVGAVVGEWWLRSRFGAMRTTRLVITLAKMAVAAAAGGAAAWFVVDRTVGRHPDTFFAALRTLLVGAVVGGVAIGLVMVVLRVAEIAPLQRRLLGPLLGRLGRGRPAATRLVASPVSPPPSVPDATPLPPTTVSPARRARPASHPNDTRGMRGSTPAAPSPPGVPGRGAAAAAGRPHVPGASSPAPVSDFAEQVTKLVTAPSDGSPPGPGSPADPAGPSVPGAPIPAGRPAATDPAHTQDQRTAAAAARAPGSDDPTVNVAGLVRPKPPATALAPGATVGGRYRLVSLIATDATGNRFWRAKDNVLPRDMAVTLLPEDPQTSATVARTLRVGRLNHIGLPQTLDVGTDNGQAYVVGQWVDGATLTDLLSSGPLEPDVATSITAKIAEAVAEAHRNGIALGAINPSLVRVNFDGQVRLSHVIAHANATPEEDIRAVGALLYLMLTGAWPLPLRSRSSRDVARGLPTEPRPGSPEVGLTPAPTRLGREVPARDVRPSVPEALSALADHALHPDEPAGIHAVSAIASLLRRPEAGSAVAAPEPSANAPTAVATLSPGERRLIKERRVKLGIASAVLVAFLVLIIIVVASLTKQFLTNVAGPTGDTGGSNGTLLPTGTAGGASSTAKTTGKASTTKRSTSGSPTKAATSKTTAPTTTPTTRTTSSALPPAAPVAVIGATVYDPKGHGSKDNTFQTPLLFDGNPATKWNTFDYKQQFPTLKPGVGVMIQLAQAESPASVTIGSDLLPATVEILAATGPDVPLESTKVLATATLSTNSTTIDLKNAPRSAYFAIFFTKLGNSPTNPNDFRGDISEVTVTGRTVSTSDSTGSAAPSGLGAGEGLSAGAGSGSTQTTP